MLGILSSARECYMTPSATCQGNALVRVRILSEAGISTYAIKAFDCVMEEQVHLFKFGYCQLLISAMLSAILSDVFNAFHYCPR